MANDGAKRHFVYESWAGPEVFDEFRKALVKGRERTGQPSGGFDAAVLFWNADGALIRYAASPRLGIQPSRFEPLFRTTLAAHSPEESPAAVQLHHEYMELFIERGRWLTIMALRLDPSPPPPFDWELRGQDVIINRTHYKHLFEARSGVAPDPAVLNQDLAARFAEEFRHCKEMAPRARAALEDIEASLGPQLSAWDGEPSLFEEVRETVEGLVQATS